MEKVQNLKNSEIGQFVVRSPTACSSKNRETIMLCDLDGVILHCANVLS
jgi:hypothetical protein